ncbi:hypothetical protein [Chelatococcus reniformis]|uniref:hypothetical protein n=1 Tax=Chelatococcus reniformis TaxID=1494448 RepID=UPI00166E2A8C|nr:hypothetical protein [Chelatococcus reniformis]
MSGLAHWVEDDTAYLSVAFTWRLDDAYQLAIYYRALGLKVRAGGPGIFTRKHYLADVAEIGGSVPDALRRHNSMATIASRGCSVGCWFCIVPKMEGRSFTELPDFPVRPVLCDNNLSALSPEYQDHIVGRYQAAGVPLLDANSGFEPRTFDDAVYARWRGINRGPWRFAYDDEGDGPHVERVMQMLLDVSPRRKRVYVLIGNEPFDACMARIRRVIDWGGEPHAQPFIKLNALIKTPHVRHDWNAQLLRDVARWTNRFGWKFGPFEDYRRSAKGPAAERGQLFGANP